MISIVLDNIGIFCGISFAFLLFGINIVWDLFDFNYKRYLKKCGEGEE